MATKPFDFRSLNKYFTSQGADDLNKFLEKVPQNAGQAALIAGGISWVAVAVLGLLLMLESQKLTELRATLASSESLKPIVPVMSMDPVSADEVKVFADKAKTLYPGLTVTSNANVLTIQSRDTSSYAQFREIMGHVLSGGAGWKVSVNSMCIGRECPQNALDASLKIEKINITKPAIEEISASASAPTEGQAPPAQ